MQEFIEEMELIDVPCIGNIFTWFNGGGIFMSILDRFMLLQVIGRILYTTWNAR